jgi:uncharacterized protein
MNFKALFTNVKPIIGMVHLLPLPETPDFVGDIDAIYVRALNDAKTLADAKLDGLIMENFGDEPYFVGEPTLTQLAMMAAITREVQRSVTIPVGVNVQFNAWQSEIAIAYACGAQFVRVEVFIDTVIGAQGVVHPCSAQITRFRRAIGAQGIALWADIQTKYTQNLLPQSISQSAIDAQNAGADALIVTGTATGQATPLDSVAAVKSVVDLPVIVGSGATPDTIQQILEVADGAIVGSALKEAGIAHNPVAVQLARDFMSAVHS